MGLSLLKHLENVATNSREIIVTWGNHHPWSHDTSPRGYSLAKGIWYLLLNGFVIVQLT